MHIEFAADMVTQWEGMGAPHKAVEAAASEREFLSLVEQVGGEKEKSIAATMKAATGHKKVTSKQRFAISKFLLETYGDARSVFAAAYATDVDSFMANAGQ